MTLDNLIMPPSVLRESKRLLERIQQAETITEAVKRGSVAEGFVLGIATLGAMEPATLEQMDILFSQAADDQALVLSESRP
jgi:hypothetical protein